MLTRLSKDVICVKDIQSNLIEEAFFILKSNGLEEMDTNNKRRDIAMLEIGDLIEDYSTKLKIENEQYRKETERKVKMKNTKMKIILLAMTFLVTCLIVVLANL